MRHLHTSATKASLLLAAFIWLTPRMAAPLLAATAGTLVPILGDTSTLAYDSAHQLLFVSNTSQNRIEVYSQAKGLLLSPIPVGNSPKGIVIIPENKVLLVCNSKDSYLSVIDLSTLTQTDTISVTSRTPGIIESPISIAALAGGTALLSTTLGLQTVDVTGKTTTALIPATGVAVPANSNLVATGDNKLVLGQGGGVAFLYNPTIPVGNFEQSRIVTNTSVMAADATGSRFMIGDSQFDRGFYQASELNPLSSPNGAIGGIVFSTDGSQIFVGYSQQSSKSQIGIFSASDLTLRAAYQVPDPIIGPMTISADGTVLFALSASGITVLDVSKLPSLPYVQVSTKFLEFNFQICDLSPKTQTIQITNSGRGTFSWKASASAASITLDSFSGDGPASLYVTVNPAGFTFRGTALIGSVTISSDDSVSGDQTVPILLNLRNPDQVGTLFPVDGYLSDILLDELRGRIYLVNTKRNQIEIFSIAQQAFLTPVSVGSIPKSIAFSSDKKLLFVSTLGSEAVTELDADTLLPVFSVRFFHSVPGPNPPLGTHPFSIVQPSNGPTLIVATTLESTPRGTVYQLSVSTATPTAFPSLSTLPNAVNGLTYMASSSSGSTVFLAESTGSLHLFDTTTGNFALNRSVSTTISGNVAASADGSYFHANNQVLSSGLVPRDAIPSGITGTAVATTGFTFAPNGTGAYRGIRAANASGSNVSPRIEKLDVASSTLVSGFNIAEGLTPSSNSLLLAIMRQLAVDRAEATLYGISDSGFMVIPLTTSSGAPQINSGGIVNGASFALSPAPIAPGSIATIFGSNLSKDIQFPSGLPLPRVLGSTCVTFDGVPVPLFFASPGQLNVQVPWEVFGKTSVQAAVSSGSLFSLPVSVNLAALAPGIFTISGNGQGAGAILHSSNFSLVSTSNPARIGEIISIYTTGMGPTSPQIATGAPAPTDGSLYRSTTPTVTIGNVSAPVAFAGLAPGFVGLYQVDVRIPSNAPIGIGIPVVISLGTPGNNSPSLSNPATITIIPAQP